MDAHEQPQDQERRALPRDASLGQRLGSLLKGALSFPKQTSYMPIDQAEAADEADDAAASQHSKRSLDLPRELSLRDRYSSSPRTSQSFPGDASKVASPRGKMRAPVSLSGGPTLGVEGSPSGSEASNVDTVPQRRALPRDASYLPDWVTQPHRQTPGQQGDGTGSPRLRLGPSVSTASLTSESEQGANAVALPFALTMVLPCFYHGSIPLTRGLPGLPCTYPGSTLVDALLGANSPPFVTHSACMLHKLPSTHACASALTMAHAIHCCCACWFPKDCCLLQTRALCRNGWTGPICQLGMPWGPDQNLKMIQSPPYPSSWPHPTSEQSTSSCHPRTHRPRTHSVMPS